MGRYYRLSKKLTEEQTAEVLREIEEIENVDVAEIIKDRTCLKIATKDNQFTDVMGKIVNLCSRAAGGAELSFDGFVTE